MKEFNPVIKPDVKRRIIVPIKPSAHSYGPHKSPRDVYIMPRDLYKQIRAKLHKIAAGRQSFGDNVQVAQDILGMLDKNSKENN